MDNTKTYQYCDRCGLPISQYQPSFEHQSVNLCPECATKLYQKIFGNTEADKQ